MLSCGLRLRTDFLGVEIGDSNFPVDLAAAMQLFIMAELRGNASTCKVCAMSVLPFVQVHYRGSLFSHVATGVYGCTDQDS